MRFFLSFLALSLTLSTLLMISGCKGSAIASKYDLEKGILIGREYYDSTASLGRVKETMDLGFPQGTLSNFATDALFDFGVEVFDPQLDFVMIDNGYFRGNIKDGNLTVAQIIELLPEDPHFVGINLKGDKLKELVSWVISQMSTHHDTKKFLPIAGLKLHLKHDQLMSIVRGEDEIKDNDVYKGIVPARFLEKNALETLPVKPIQVVPITQGLREIIGRYILEFGLTYRPVTDLRIVQEF